MTQPLPPPDKPSHDAVSSSFDAWGGAYKTYFTKEGHLEITLIDQQGLPLVGTDGKPLVRLFQVTVTVTNKKLKDSVETIIATFRKSGHLQQVAEELYADAAQRAHHTAQIAPKDTPQLILSFGLKKQALSIEVRRTSAEPGATVARETVRIGTLRGDKAKGANRARATTQFLPSREVSLDRAKNTSELMGMFKGYSPASVHKAVQAILDDRSLRLLDQKLPKEWHERTLSQVLKLPGNEGLLEALIHLDNAAVAEMQKNPTAAGKGKELKSEGPRDEQELLIYVLENLHKGPKIIRTKAKDGSEVASVMRMYQGRASLELSQRNKVNPGKLTGLFTQDHARPALADKVKTKKKSEHPANLAAVSLQVKGKDGSVVSKCAVVRSGRIDSAKRQEQLALFTLLQQLEVSQPAGLRKISSKGVDGVPVYEFRPVMSCLMDLSRLKGSEREKVEHTFKAQAEWPEDGYRVIVEMDGQEVEVRMLKPIMPHQIFSPSIRGAGLTAERRERGLFTQIGERASEAANFVANNQLLHEYLRDSDVEAQELRKLQKCSVELNAALQARMKAKKGEADLIMRNEKGKLAGLVNFDKVDVTKLLQTRWEGFWNQSPLDAQAIQKYQEAVSAFLLNRLDRAAQAMAAINKKDTPEYKAALKEYNALVALYSITFQKSPPQLAAGDGELHAADMQLYRQIVCKSLNQGSGLPVCVHCKSGTERTGESSALFVAAELYEAETGEPFMPAQGADLRGDNEALLRFKKLHRQAIFEQSLPLSVETRGWLGLKWGEGFETTLLAGPGRGQRQGNPVPQKYLLLAEDVAQGKAQLKNLGFPDDVQADVEGLSYEDLRAKGKQQYIGQLAKPTALAVYGRATASTRQELAGKPAMNPKQTQEINRMLRQLLVVELGLSSDEVPETIVHSSLNLAIELRKLKLDQKIPGTSTTRLERLQELIQANKLPTSADKEVSYALRIAVSLLIDLGIELVKLAVPLPTVPVSRMPPQKPLLQALAMSGTRLVAEEAEGTTREATPKTLEAFVVQMTSSSRDFLRKNLLKTPLEFENLALIFEQLELHIEQELAQATKNEIVDPDLVISIANQSLIKLVNEMKPNQRLTLYEKLKNLPADIVDLQAFQQLAQVLDEQLNLHGQELLKMLQNIAKTGNDKLVRQSVRILSTADKKLLLHRIKSWKNELAPGVEASQLKFFEELTLIALASETVEPLLNKTVAKRIKALVLMTPKERLQLRDQLAILEIVHKDMQSAYQQISTSLNRIEENETLVPKLLLQSVDALRSTFKNMNVEQRRNLLLQLQEMRFPDTAEEKKLQVALQQLIDVSHELRDDLAISQNINLIARLSSGHRSEFISDLAVANAGIIPTKDLFTLIYKEIIQADGSTTIQNLLLFCRQWTKEHLRSSELQDPAIRDLLAQIAGSCLTHKLQYIRNIAEALKADLNVRPQKKFPAEGIAGSFDEYLIQMAARGVKPKDYNGYVQNVAADLKAMQLAYLNMIAPSDLLLRPDKTTPQSVEELGQLSKNIAKCITLKISVAVGKEAIMDRVKFFIRVGSECLRTGDLASGQAIYSALTAAAMGDPEVEKVLNDVIAMKPPTHYDYRSIWPNLAAISDAETITDLITAQLVTVDPAHAGEMSKKRQAVVKFFLRVAAECLKIGNFETAQAIRATLENAAANGLINESLQAVLNIGIGHFPYSDTWTELSRLTPTVVQVKMAALKKTQVQIPVIARVRSEVQALQQSGSPSVVREQDQDVYNFQKAKLLRDATDGYLIAQDQGSSAAKPLHTDLLTEVSLIKDQNFDQVQQGAKLKKLAVQYQTAIQNNLAKSKDNPNAEAYLYFQAKQQLRDLQALAEINGEFQQAVVAIQKQMNALQSVANKNMFMRLSEEDVTLRDALLRNEFPKSATAETITRVLSKLMMKALYSSDQAEVMRAYQELFRILEFLSPTAEERAATKKVKEAEVSGGSALTERDKELAKSVTMKEELNKAVKAQMKKHPLFEFFSNHNTEEGIVRVLNTLMLTARTHVNKDERMKAYTEIAQVRQLIGKVGKEQPVVYGIKAKIRGQVERLAEYQLYTAPQSTTDLILKRDAELSFHYGQAKGAFSRIKAFGEKRDEITLKDLQQASIDWGHILLAHQYLENSGFGAAVLNADATFWKNLLTETVAVLNGAKERSLHCGLKPEEIDAVKFAGVETAQGFYGTFSAAAPARLSGASQVLEVIRNNIRSRDPHLKIDPSARLVMKQPLTAEGEQLKDELEKIGNQILEQVRFARQLAAVREGSESNKLKNAITNKLIALNYLEAQFSEKLNQLKNSYAGGLIPDAIVELERKMRSKIAEGLALANGLVPAYHKALITEYRARIADQLAFAKVAQHNGLIFQCNAQALFEDLNRQLSEPLEGSLYILTQELSDQVEEIRINL